MIVEKRRDRLAGSVVTIAVSPALDVPLRRGYEALELTTWRTGGSSSAVTCWTMMEIPYKDDMISTWPYFWWSVKQNPKYLKQGKQGSKKKF